MNPNEKAARRRDNAIAAGAVLAGGGVAAGGYGAIRAAKSIKTGVDDFKKTSSHVRDTATQVADKLAKTADQVGGQVSKTGEAVRQNARRAGKAAGAPGRVVAKAGRAGGKVISKLKKFFKMEAHRTEITEFRASEVKKGTMMVDGILVDIRELEKIVAKKKVIQIPLRDVTGIARTKGLSKDRLRNVAGVMDKPGIITSDNVLIDGRHRARMRAASGIDVGLFRRATKADLKAAAVEPEELSAKMMETCFAKIPIDPMFHGFLGKSSLRVSDRKTLKQIKDQGARIINKTEGKGQRVAKRMLVGHEAGGYARVKLDKLRLKTTGKTTPDLPFADRKKDLSRRGKAHYFMATEDPSVKEEKKRKKQIRGIGRILRLQFAAKENKEERYASIYDNGDDLIKAGATGAATGGIVGGPVGAVIGGGASVAGQLKASRVGARKEEERKPIQGKIARNAIPAAMVAAGAGLATERGGKIMKKTKAIGRLVRKRLKNLEARIDSVTEFSKSKQWIKTEGEHKGSYEHTQRVLDGRVKPMVRDPNYDPKAFPGSAHSQPFKDDDTPIGINKQAWRASERKAKTAVKWGGRAKNAASDLKDVVTGKPRKKDQAGRAKKREWEKSYAKNAIATGVAAGGIMAGNAYLRKNPQKRDALYGAADRATSGIIKKGKKLMAKAFSEGEPRPGMIELMTLTEGLGVLAAGGVAVGGAGMLARKALKKRKEKREKRELSEIRPGMIHEFVSVRDDSGRQVFRVEDARGNSARIHAGDKPKRERREKYWHERSANQKKIAGAAIVGAGVGGVIVGAKGKEIAKGIGDSKLYKGAKSSKAGKMAASAIDRMVSPKRKIIKEIARRGASGLAGMTN